MNCHQCGNDNPPGATHCSQCGAAFSGNALPEAGGIAPEAGKLALWNPSVTVNWSLIFTPAFGAYLQMLNWRALGEPGKAMWSAIWFYASLGMLGLYIYMGAASGDPLAEDKIAQAISFSYLLVWYFSFGKTQSGYVKEKLGKDYVRKSWIRPLLSGAGGIVAFYLLAVVAGWLVRIAR